MALRQPSWALPRTDPLGAQPLVDSQEVPLPPGHAPGTEIMEGPKTRVLHMRRYATGGGSIRLLIESPMVAMDTPILGLLLRKMRLNPD